MAERPRPLCFVAMPFGRKAPAGRDAPLIDFDRVYEVIRDAVVAEKLDCIRADFESTGGFIHSPMYERLIVSEYVIADLTFANANVAYEVGVRHGAGAGVTLLVCAASETRNLPFDFRPLRVIPYELGDDGTLGADARAKLAGTLADRLRLARAGEIQTDNPIAQVLRSSAQPGAGHEKTDVFLNRLRYAGQMAERIAEAIELSDDDQALAELRSIEAELLGDSRGDQVVPQLFTALLALYLAYREKKAWQSMIALAGRLPRTLRQTAVVIEQLALALNRAAEAHDEAGEDAQAEQLRRRALRELDAMPEGQHTSETWGIVGRIYKARSNAHRAAGRTAQADADLGKAIELYERGLRADPRDYFPGVNAVTLRLSRATPADEAALAALVPVVRFAVDRAPQPRDRFEEYWQLATKFELACAERDWPAAQEAFNKLLAVPVADWMRETTAGNLRIHLHARQNEPESIRNLESFSSALGKKSAGSQPRG